MSKIQEAQVVIAVGKKVLSDVEKETKKRVREENKILHQRRKR